MRVPFRHLRMRLTCHQPLWHIAPLDNAKVAQLAEHRIRNATVIGSNPIFGSTLFRNKSP